MLPTGKKLGLHSRDRGMFVKTWNSCFHICTSPSALSVALSFVQLPSLLSQLWSPKLAIPNFFGNGDRFRGRQLFHRLRVGCGWFRDDSSALHLLCTLFLLQLHQLHLRSSGIRSPRLGTPGLNHKLVDCCYSFVLYYLINMYNHHWASNIFLHNGITEESASFMGFGIQMVVPLPI